MANNVDDKYEDLVLGLKLVGGLGLLVAGGFLVSVLGGQKSPNSINPTGQYSERVQSQAPSEVQGVTQTEIRNSQGEQVDFGAVYQMEWRATHCGSGVKSSNVRQLLHEVLKDDSTLRSYERYKASQGDPSETGADQPTCPQSGT